MIGKLLFVFLFIIVSLKGTSQVTVEGKVIDTANSPIRYATVMLYENDSIITGAVTNNIGLFRFENLNEGTYQLVISHIGYKAYSAETEILANTNIEKIVLYQSIIDIDEYSVVAYGNNIGLNVDGLKFEVTPIIKKNAKDAFQVLTYVPELTVNTIDKSVGIIGVDNSLILINNVDMGKEALFSLDPKDILSIEVISNPSSKYISRDVTGVINIITKEKQNGCNFRIAQMTSLTNGFYNTDYYLVKGSINIYANLYYSFLNEDNIDIEHISSSYINDTLFSKESHSKSKEQKKNSGSVKGGMQYSFNKNSFILLDMKIEGLSFPSKEENYGMYMANESILYDFNNSKKSEDIELKGVYSLYYQNKFNPNSELAIEGKVNSFTNNFAIDFEEYYSNSVFSNYSNSTTIKNSYDVQIDYSLLFNKLQLETGYRVYFQDVAQSIDYKNNESLSNTFDFQEVKNYLYFNVKRKLNSKISFKLGLGNEFTSNKINSTEFTNSYYRALPNFGIICNLANKHNVNFNFRSSLNRPSVSSLNPTIRYSDSIKVYQGNPLLEPYFNYSFTAKYSFSNSKVYLSPSLQYTITPGKITNIGRTTSTGTYLMTYENIATFNSYKFIINYNHKILKGLILKVNFSSVYSVYNDNVSNSTGNLWTYGYNISSVYKLNSFSFYLSYRKRPKILLGDLIAQNNDDSWLSVNYVINNQWSTGLNLRYFIPWEEHSYLEDDFFFEESNKINMNRYLQVIFELSWKIEKGNKASKKRKKINNYDSIDGLKID